MTVETNLNSIASELEKDLQSGLPFQALQNKYLKKDGLIRQFYQEMKHLSAEEKQKVGQTLNLLKERIEAQGQEGEKLSNKQIHRALDISRQPYGLDHGALHPITQALNEATEIFEGFGFDIVDDCELETTEYCFDRLRIPEWHSARDSQDTFYIQGIPHIALRPHTTATQLKILEKQQPPVQVISIGKVYRSDELDATHTPVFHQIDGFMVGQGLSFAHLKGTLEMFVRAYIPGVKKIRFRPHYFSYTEPSLELDVQCVLCEGRGCKACKRQGWIEMLGAGMMHPDLFVDAGYERDKYTGFAFGCGVERLVMQRHCVEDIRFLYNNEIDLIQQLGR